MLVLVALAACSKGKSADEKQFTIKPVPVAHVPQPGELGPPVEAKTGYQALCAAVPDDGKQRTDAEISAYIRGATFQYPNSQVVQFVESLGELRHEDARKAFRGELDKHGIGTCRLLDLLAKH